MINVDDKSLMIALSNMSFKKMNSVYKKAMKKSLEPLVKQTKQNLRKSGIKNVGKKKMTSTGKLWPSMLSGIKTSINTDDNKGDSYGKVHILGEYRLKFFEKGTKTRKTKKGYNRGSISPRWFFRSAVSEKTRECENILDENIRKSIYDTWQRK